MARRWSHLAEGIVNLVNEVELEELVQFLDIDLDQVIALDSSVTNPTSTYLKRWLSIPRSCKKSHLRSFSRRFMGAELLVSMPVLRKLGVEVVEVTEQMEPDGRFPTVKSPNPENAEALAMAIAKLIKRMPTSSSRRSRC